MHDGAASPRGNDILEAKVVGRSDENASMQIELEPASE
jgi:hypothetical protein